MALFLGITKGPSHDDDYGFLCPNGKVICPKVIKDQVNPMRSVTFQEEMFGEHTSMLTTETYQVRLHNFCDFIELL